MDDTPQTRSGTFFVKGEKIVLRRDGTWVADGVEITHEGTRDLFFKTIAWDPGERKYCLKIGYETMHIEVEDTPYFVTSIERQQTDCYLARLSNFTDVSLQAARLSYERGNLYLALDNGQRAKFLSAPYYSLLRDLQEDDRAYFLSIAGTRADLALK